MAIYSMKITQNDEDNSQARIIIEVNGHEIDILADKEGIAIDINNGSKIVASGGIEWPQPNA